MESLNSPVLFDSLNLHTTLIAIIWSIAVNAPSHCNQAPIHKVNQMPNISYDAFGKNWSTFENGCIINQSSPDQPNDGNPFQNGRRRSRRGLSSAHSLGVEELSLYFHLPISEAARQIGVCATVLKKICRKNNIQRWPHRKMKSLGKIVTTLGDSVERNIYNTQFKKYIETVQDHRSIIMERIKPEVGTSSMERTAQKSKFGSKIQTSSSNVDFTQNFKVSSNEDQVATKKVKREANKKSTNAEIVQNKNQFQTTQGLSHGRRFELTSDVMLPRLTIKTKVQPRFISSTGSQSYQIEPPTPTSNQLPQPSQPPPTPPPQISIAANHSGPPLTNQCSMSQMYLDANTSGPLYFLSEDYFMHPLAFNSHSLNYHPYTYEDWSCRLSTTASSQLWTQNLSSLQGTTSYSLVSSHPTGDESVPYINSDDYQINSNNMGSTLLPSATSTSYPSLSSIGFPYSNSVCTTMPELELGYASDITSTTRNMIATDINSGYSNNQDNTIGAIGGLATANNSVIISPTTTCFDPQQLYIFQMLRQKS